MIKYDWLFPQQPSDTDDLKKILDTSILEYNTIRPHYAHKVYTPDEVYYGKNSSFDLKAYLNEARGARKIENLEYICSDC